MIKFFQKLKAKKGFTLVELIVVIAIIGVLAAILIPTMLGYVTSSRVQSANSTAAEIKNMVNNFITDMDTKGFTFDRSGNHSAVIKIGVAASTDGTAQPTINESTGFDTDAFVTSDAKDKKAINDEFIRRINEDFNFSKCYAIVYISKGNVVGCAYSSDAKDVNTDVTMADFVDNDHKKFGKWGDTDGVLGETATNKGLIVGTAPQLTKALGGGDDE